MAFDIALKFYPPLFDHIKDYNMDAKHEELVHTFLCTFSAVCGNVHLTVALKFARSRLVSTTRIVTFAI